MGKYIINKQSGFTLIETFVGIIVLTIAVIGPLSLLADAIADGNYAKQQITAFYLAQEGAELVISRRDENVGSSNNWLNGLEYCFSECQISIDINNRNNISTAPCSLNASIKNGNGCARIYQTESGHGIYTHTSSDGAVATPFYRTVKITPRTINDDIKIGIEVESVVKWVDKGIVRTPVHVTSFIANHLLK